MGSKKLFNLIADHFDLANRSPAEKKKILKEEIKFWENYILIPIV